MESDKSLSRRLLIAQADDLRLAANRRAEEARRLDQVPHVYGDLPTETRNLILAEAFTVCAAMTSAAAKLREIAARLPE